MGQKLGSNIVDGFSLSVYTDRCWDGIMSVGKNYRRKNSVGKSVGFRRFSGSVSNTPPQVKALWTWNLHKSTPYYAKFLSNKWGWLDLNSWSLGHQGSDTMSKNQFKHDLPRYHTFYWYWDCNISFLFFAHFKPKNMQWITFLSNFLWRISGINTYHTYPNTLK